MSIKTVYFDIGNTLVRQKQWLEGAQSSIAKLKQHKIKIGIISNTGQLSRDELADLLPEDFDFSFFDEGLVLLSSETGLEKPNLHTFLMAVQHCNCSPWETLFIGEDLEETIAAQKAGMRAARCVNKNDLSEITNSVVKGI